MLVWACVRVKWRCLRFWRPRSGWLSGACVACSVWKRRWQAGWKSGCCVARQMLYVVCAAGSSWLGFTVRPARQVVSSAARWCKWCMLCSHATVPSELTCSSLCSQIMYSSTWISKFSESVACECCWTARVSSDCGLCKGSPELGKTAGKGSEVPSYQRRPSSPRKREGNVRFPTNLHGVRRSARPTSMWAPCGRRLNEDQQKRRCASTGIVWQELGNRSANKDDESM